MSPVSGKCRFMAALLLFFLLASLFSLPAAASAPLESAPEEERVGAAYLINLDNDLVLYEKNSRALMYPAASVKIMAGLIACRALADRLSETVTITSAMLAGSAGRNMGLQDGEIITIHDLLYAAFCGGYNDAVCTVAYLTAGSVAAFVEQMNAEALKIGTTSTVYTNPTGLHDANMMTTAADTARVATAAWKNQLFMEITSEKNHTIPATNLAGERYFSNRNALISDTSHTYYNGYCRGMNAGMIDESPTGRNGWCVITVWEKNGVSNLAIVLDGMDVDSGDVIPAYRYVNRLLSWADRNYSYQTVLTAQDPIGQYPVAMTGIGSTETEVTIPHDVTLYLPKNTDIEKEISFDIILDDDGLEAPLKAGQRVGVLRILYRDTPTSTVPLIVSEDFSRSGFLEVMQNFKSYLTSRPFFATIIIFIILLLLYLRWTSGPGRRYSTGTTKRRSAQPMTKKRKYRKYKRRFR